MPFTLVRSDIRTATVQAVFSCSIFSFDVLGKWEIDRGDQFFGYDFWWHLTQDTLLTSEWGTPNQIENGIIPEELLQSKYGHQLHVWDLRRETAC